MNFNADLVHELNILIRFNLDASGQGIKIHGSADPSVIAATQRLHKKGLLTQLDGGYLTNFGRNTAEHAQSLITILTSNPDLVQTMNEMSEA